MGPNLRTYGGCRGSFFYEFSRKLGSGKSGLLQRVVQRWETFAGLDFEVDAGAHQEVEHGFVSVLDGHVKRGPEKQAPILGSYTSDFRFSYLLTSTKRSIISPY